MAELGTGYIQIKPTTKGLEGAISEQLAGEGTKAGKLSGLNIAKALKGVLAGAAVGKFFADTLKEGGKLEQSIGGIETLFKDSAETVKANAALAFKTSGMSANEYMENTTSFAASLISSVGGNTQEAANLADMAMKDMSDNANKMGTDLSSITGTYQSLARGNYAMLDNLKLGYGGTKSEMERLMKDAEKLTGEHYTVGDFGDTVKAIHAVQENLGITGTTAKEAASTLQGSMGMMKSAFKDLMGNLATGGDVSGALQNVLSSVSTFLFGNAIPMVGRVLSGIGSALINTDWVGMISSIDWSGIGTMVGSKAAEIVTNVDWPALAVKAIDTLTVALQAAGDLLLATMDALWAGVGPALRTALQPASDYIKGTINGIKSNVTGQFKAVWNSVKTTWEGIKNSIMNPIKTAWSTVSGIVDKLKKAFDFKWKLPELKIPKITVTGGQAPFGIGGKGSLPKFDIAWNANGGIFDSANIIGFGVGEKGREAVLPIERLDSYFDRQAERMNENRGNVYNVSVTVNGAEDPERWAEQFAESMKKQFRMGVA